MLDSALYMHKGEEKNNSNILAVHFFRDSAFVLHIYLFLVNFVE